MIEDLEKRLLDAAAQVSGENPPDLMPLLTELLYQMLLFLKMQQRQIDALQAEIRCNAELLKGRGETVPVDVIDRDNLDFIAKWRR